jgi:hypothetical protein
LTWSEDDGTPIDLTGASVEWSLVAGATEFQYIDSAEAGITDATAGVVTLALTPTQTRELVATGYTWRYEVTITLADSSRETILHGVLSIAREAAE